MARNVFTKDPDATLDYVVDWINVLEATDYIVSVATSADLGITFVTQTHTSATHTIWLMGGTPNTRYQVRSKVWTVGNRVDERTITILVREL